MTVASVTAAPLIVKAITAPVPLPLVVNAALEIEFEAGVALVVLVVIESINDPIGSPPAVKVSSEDPEIVSVPEPTAI